MIYPPVFASEDGETASVRSRFMKCWSMPADTHTGRALFQSEPPAVAGGGCSGLRQLCSTDQPPATAGGSDSLQPGTRMHATVCTGETSRNSGSIRAHSSMAIGQRV